MNRGYRERVRLSSIVDKYQHSGARLLPTAEAGGSRRDGIMWEWLRSVFTGMRGFLGGVVAGDPAAMKLSAWQLVSIHIATLTSFTLVVLATLKALAANEKWGLHVVQGNPILLRTITVVLVIWAVSGLAIQGSLTEGSATIFGTIIGYVFGSMRPQSPADAGPARPAK